MNHYLQRLYDAAVGIPGAVAARPAQRSASPLLAVDQRLASPVYAEAFLRGLPGTADPDGAPPVMPDPFAEAEPVALPGRGPLAPSPTPEERPFRVPRWHRDAPAPPRPITTQPMEHVEVPVRPPGPTTRVDTPPAPTATPSLAGADPAADPASVQTEGTRLAPGHSALPVRPETPDRGQPSAREMPEPVAQPLHARQRQQPAHARSVPPRVVETGDPGRPGHQQATPGELSAPQAPTPLDATPPPMLHPRTAAAPGPLPPPPTPPVPGPVVVEERVRRLVREAMAEEPASARTVGDGVDAPAAPKAATTPRARTAEEMSVIGPLDRPPRATMLYGLRLR